MHEWDEDLRHPRPESEEICRCGDGEGVDMQRVASIGSGVSTGPGAEAHGHPEEGRIA